MDVAATIQTVIAVISAINQVAPIVIEGITDLKAFGVALYKKLSGGEISDADLAALEAQIDALSAELNSPLPPE